MKWGNLALGCVLMSTGCAHTGTMEGVQTMQDQSFRENPPVAGQAPALNAPVPTQKILSNGLTLYVVEKRNLPLVQMEMILLSGVNADTPDSRGLAGFTGAMLRRGTASHDATAFAEAIEQMGTSIHVDVDTDSTVLDATVLKSEIEGVGELMAEMLTEPAFAEKEIELERKQRLSWLAQMEVNPSQLASRASNRLLFGEHPYSSDAVGDAKFIQSLNRAKLESFFKAHFRPANAALILVGDISVEEATLLAEKVFGKWTGKPGREAAPAQASQEKPGVYFVDVPNAGQSELRIGHLGVSRSVPDYQALVLCNSILGGMFNSRINLNLREDKGFTYGARSAFYFGRSRGDFIVSTGVTAEATQASIVEVLKEIKRMQDEDVNAEELSLAKNKYTLSLPGNFQSVTAIASMMGRLFAYDLPLDYYQTFPEKMNAVSVKDIRRVARKYLKPEVINIVVAGDKAKVAPSLSQLNRGPVHFVNQDTLRLH